MLKSVPLLLALIAVSGCTASIDSTESVDPIPSPTTSAITEIAPYPFSTLIPTDFALLDQEIPAGPCSGDLTEEMCIELHGTKSSIPKGIELIDDGKTDDGYHVYTLSNDLTGSIVSFEIVDEIYDSKLTAVNYFLDDNDLLHVEFFFYYDEKILNENPKAYDIQKRVEQSGGPLFFYTAYYLDENSEGDFGIIKKQDLNQYIEEMPDEAFSEMGLEYLENLEMVKLSD